MNISPKETGESEYGTELSRRTGHLKDEEAESLPADYREPLKLFTSFARRSTEE